MATYKKGNLNMSEIIEPELQDKQKTKYARPKRYNVVLLNDDYTPMEFVILVLSEIFEKNYEDSVAIMLEVHKNGRGIAGTYSREIANQKQDDTVSLAVKNNHPLKCTVEEAPTDGDE